MPLFVWRRAGSPPIIRVQRYREPGLSEQKAVRVMHPSDVSVPLGIVIRKSPG